MYDWRVIITFTYPYEAHLAKGKLESEGIEVMINDELTAQINNFYSNAIGGVKVLVKETDFERAKQILIESGYINAKESDPPKFWTQLDKFSSKIPWIGKTILEIRLLIILSLLLFIIITPIVILSLPSTVEKLVTHSWCVEKIYLNGQEFIPHSLDINMESVFGGCNESIKFYDNGIVSFPGYYTPNENAHWILKNDTLYITPFPSEKDLPLNGNLEEKNLIQSIYSGIYHFEIKGNVLKMESDSLIIYGTAY